MNRIERYCELNAAFLRECSFLIEPGHANIAVVAEEFDGDGKVVRTWFLTLCEPGSAWGDGCCLPNTTPPHIVVGTDIRPGEPTPPPIPGVQLRISVGTQILLKIKAERDERLTTRQRHTIYCQQVLDDRAKLVTQQSRIAQLESEYVATTRELSDTINGLQSVVAARLFTIGELQSSLRSARKQKSLLYRLRLLCR